MKILWRILGIGCRTFSLMLVISVGCFFLFPSFGPLAREFTELSGEQARSRIDRFCPAGIAATDIKNAHGKSYSLIDCSAHWYQIVANPEVQELWQSELHTQLEMSSELTRGFELIEGVHRIITSPTLIETDLGKAPSWWKPSAMDLQVTERMRWYTGGGSTYADSLYSGFDPATNTLWLFESRQQHGRLWSRGNIPDGKQFVLSR